MTLTDELPDIRRQVGRPCEACEHPDRQEIDDDIRCGLRTRSISQKYAVSDHTIGRHIRHGHVEPVPSPIATQDATDPERLKARILELEERLRRWLDIFEGAGQPTLALTAARELRMTVELLAKIGGMLDDRIVVIQEAESLVLGNAMRTVLEVLIEQRDRPADELRAELPKVVRAAIETTSTG